MLCQPYQTMRALFAPERRTARPPSRDDPYWLRERRLQDAHDPAE